MTFEDYLLNLFYLIDEELEALKRERGLARLRSRGPEPVLADSEVLTMVLAGEFLGLDTDEGIYEHFRRYHRAEFPALSHVHRTTFARQAANLWRAGQLLHERLVGLLPLADPVDGEVLWVIDSFAGFPVRVCKLKRAPGSKLFKGYAGYGHDPTQGRDCFFGFRVHLRCSDRGPVAQIELAAGNVTDLAVAGELAPRPPGTALGDRNYWGPDWVEGLVRCGIFVLSPFKKKSSDPDPAGSKVLTRLRQVIEPVIGQLATRFHAERTWARDLWHLCGRLTRKVLSHTAAVLLNWRAGNPMLQLDLLVHG
jgi:hypothetical protein